VVQAVVEASVMMFILTLGMASPVKVTLVVLDVMLVLQMAAVAVVVRVV
jgi:hypothetical protein